MNFQGSTTFSQHQLQIIFSSEISFLEADKYDHFCHSLFDTLYQTLSHPSSQESNVRCMPFQNGIIVVKILARWMRNRELDPLCFGQEEAPVLLGCDRYPQSKYYQPTLLPFFRRHSVYNLRFWDSKQIPAQQTGLSIVESGALFVQGILDSKV